MKKLYFLAIVMMTFASSSFSQVVINQPVQWQHTPLGIYFSVNTDSVESVALDSSSVAAFGYLGEGFNGDTVWGSAQLLNTYDTTIHFVGAPMMQDTSAGIWISDYSSDSLEPWSDGMSGDLLVFDFAAAPWSDSTTIKFSPIIWWTDDTVGTQVNGDTTIHYITAFVSQTVSYGSFGNSQVNLNDQPDWCEWDTLTVVLDDSCGIIMPDFESLWLAEIVASDSMQSFSNVQVSQNYQAGSFIFLDQDIIIDMSFDHAWGYKYSGYCGFTTVLIDSLPENMTCPVDSIFPVPVTDGNGGQGTVTGALNDVTGDSTLKTEANSMPIEGAIVYLLDATTGTVVGEDTTDVNGEFSFNDLMAGDYTLSVRYGNLPMEPLSSVITVGPGSSVTDIVAEADDNNITVSEQLVTNLGYSEEETSFIEIFPNPTASHAFISSNSEMETLKVYDAHGAVVLNQTLSSATSTTISLDPLITGTYVIEITTANGVETQRLVKN